jgi:hypothetical protein
MTVNARITTTERDAEIVQHIHAADLEIARVMQRLAPIAGLIGARLRLKAAMSLIEVEKVEEVLTTEEILQSEG